MSMEKRLQQYLRILDIDPTGYYLRLMNKSKSHSIDLTNVQIQQRKTNDESIVNSYKFDRRIQTFLPAGQCVTIYSREYLRVRREIEPNIFIADHVARWSTSNSIRTEILFNEQIFDQSNKVLPCDNDVPYLYVHSVFPSVKTSRRVKSAFAPRPVEFQYPYCLSDNNIVHPNTSAVPNRKLIEWRSSICRSATPLVKDFDTYPRRLTTSPKRIQSSKIRMSFY